MTKYAIQNPGANGGVTKKSTAPRTSTTKSISYSDTTNDLLLDISKDASASSQKSGDI